MAWDPASEAPITGVVEIPTNADQPSIAEFDVSQLDLPMLPDVAAEVMELCQHEDTDAARLSETLHRDQTLASNVLRVANSPLYAPAVPIASLAQAIGRLGLRQVADLALSVSLRGLVFRDSHHAEQLRRYWNEALAAGFFAKEVARTRRSNVDSAFLCGLLHDIGKALLLSNLDTLDQTVDSQDRSELTRFLEDYHGVAGRALAVSWKLPPQICAAIAEHHDWNQAAEHRQLIAMTWLADRLACACLEDDDTATRDQILESGVMEELDLYPDDLDGLLVRTDEVRAMVEEVA